MKKRLLIVPFILALSLTACNSSDSNTNQNNSETQTQNETVQTETTENETAQSENEEAEKEETVPEPNTSEMVDYIYYQAKDEIETNGLSEEKRDEAVKFLVDNYPNYFVDNETMEKTMYYGCYLDIGCKDDELPYEDLGTDAYQVVKYVYRGAEKIEDNGTQENLKQIKESLNELGFNVN